MARTRRAGLREIVICATPDLPELELPRVRMTAPRHTDDGPGQRPENGDDDEHGDRRGKAEGRRASAGRMAPSRPVEAFDKSIEPTFNTIACPSATSMIGAAASVTIEIPPPLR